MNQIANAVQSTPSTLNATPLLSRDVKIGVFPWMLGEVEPPYRTKFYFKDLQEIDIWELALGAPMCELFDKQIEPKNSESVDDDG